MNLALSILLAFPCVQEPAPQATPEPQAVELSLKTAMRLANDYSLSLQLARESNTSTRYERDARWAKFGWQLRIDGSLSDSEYEGSSELSGAPVLTQREQGLEVTLTRPTALGPTFELIYDSKETTTNNSYAYLPHSTNGDLSLGITQRLLAGRGRNYTTALQYQADKEHAYATEVVRSTQRNLTDQVFTAYWTLAATQGALQSADLGVKSAEDFTKYAKDRFDAGLGLELDMLQAQSELARQRATRVQAYITNTDSEDKLRALIYSGNSISTWSSALVASDSFPVFPERPELLGWGEAYRLARITSPNLQALEHRIDIAKRLVSVAKSDEQSRLDLQLRFRSTGFEKNAFDAWDESLNREYPAFSAALRWELPLSATAPRSKTKKTRAELRRAQLELDNAERKLTSELRTAFRSIELQYTAFIAAETAESLAQRQHQLEMARYREGRSTALRVQSALKALLESSALRLKSQANHVITLGKLDVLTGKHDR